MKMKTSILLQWHGVKMKSPTPLKRYGLKMKTFSRSMQCLGNRRVLCNARISIRIAALACFFLLLLLVVRSVLAQADQYEGTPISSTVFVAFASGSARFLPGADSAARLEDAKAAALISIRGRTSTNAPTPKDEALALARAISARSYLIAHGVSPLKISLNYASAADFIADNSTPDGQLQNQRVEIDIVHVPSPRPE
jgi:flagellar motor protein MotB